MKTWWRTRPSKHGQPTWPAIVGLLTIPVVGFANYYAGTQISFLIFYLPSIALVGWQGGSWFGVSAAITAAVAWLIADINSDPPLHDLTTSYVNALLRFVIFLMFGLLFAALRQNRDNLQKTVTEKTSALQKEIAERARIQHEVTEISARQQRQIAYDLHDGVGQHLSGVAFKSKLLEQKLRAEGSAQADEAAAITRLINDALRQTRTVARSMESTYGEARGLREALEKLGEELKENSQIMATVNIHDSVEAVSAPTDMQLLRIAQEAVHNATKHGGASRIEIALDSSEDAIVLSVHDDGRGFDGVPKSDGMGMRTMRYRAETIGGSLVVDSSPGKGTTVSCRVPKESVAGKAKPQSS